EPGRLQAVLLEQLEQPRRPDLTGEQAPRDVVGRILSAVRPEPAGHGVDVDADAAEDLLGHVLLLVGGTTLRHVRSLRCATGGSLGRARGRSARTGAPGRARQPCTRTLRTPPRGLEWPGLRSPGPQGPDRSRSEPGLALGRGGAAGRPAARSPR